MQNPDIPEVNHQPRRLPENQHGVMPHNRIAHDDGRAAQADEPEPQGQHRLVPLPRINPLVHEPQRENNLPQRAVNQEPQGHFLVLEKLADESPRLREHVPDGEERRSNQDVADGTRDFLPIVLDVEVPDVNVIGIGCTTKSNPSSNSIISRLL